MSDQSIERPDLNILLKEHKFDILSSINCVQIGRVKSFNSSKQTAEINIQVKRRVNGRDIIDYPMLVDCPVFFLQGGGGYIDLPVSEGDYCLILFNDRDIDTWFSSANVAEPATNRAHDLSDGFALVGINPSTRILNIDGALVRIVGPGGSDNISISDSGEINIGTGGNSAARKGDSTQLSLTPADVVALASSLLATGAFTPSGSGPVPPPTGPTFTGGEITGGSTEVNIK